jgi:phosphate transporter
VRALDVELEKITSFFASKEGELVDEVTQLLRDVSASGDESAEETGPPREGDNDDVELGRARARVDTLDVIEGGRGRARAEVETPPPPDSDDDESDGSETARLTRARILPPRRKSVGPMSEASHDAGTATTYSRRPSRRRSVTATDFGENSMMFSSSLFNSNIMLKKRITSLYVQMCEFKSYSQLNKTGFGKVLKKFDKILDRELRPRYLKQHVETAYPFKPETMAAVDRHIGNLVAAYAEVATHADQELARRELRSHLREHVVWERNTVWRDLIGIERRAAAASLGSALLGQGGGGIGGGLLQGDDAKPLIKKKVWTPFGKVIVPSWLAGTSTLVLTIAIVVFLVMLWIPFMERPEQQNCFALLVFVSVLWATEVRWRKKNRSLALVVVLV